MDYSIKIVLTSGNRSFSEKEPWRERGDATRARGVPGEPCSCVWLRAALPTSQAPKAPQHAHPSPPIQSLEKRKLPGAKRTDFHHRTALLALLPALLRLAPVRRDDGDAVQPVGWTLVACLLGGWHLGRCLGWPPLPSRTVSLPRCRRVTSQGETRSYFGGGSRG